jgi:hypothetical protein
MARLNTASVVPPAPDAGLANFNSSAVQVDDSALPLCPLLVWVKSALRPYDNGFVRFGNRPSPKVNEGPLICRFDFFWRALQSVVGFEVGTTRAYKYLSVSPIGFQDKNAFRISAKNLSLGAVRGHVVVGDERPGSDELIFERFFAG